MLTDFVCMLEVNPPLLKLVNFDYVSFFDTSVNIVSTIFQHGFPH